ncbi:hypothetical protein, partial [Oceanivirga salmonicida]
MKKFLISIALLFTMSCSSIVISSIDLLGNKILANKDEVYLQSGGTNETALTKNPYYTLEHHILRYDEGDKEDVVYYRYYTEESKNLIIYVHGGAFVNTSISDYYLRFLEKLRNRSGVDFEVI